MSIYRLIDTSSIMILPNCFKGSEKNEQIWVFMQKRQFVQEGDLRRARNCFLEPLESVAPTIKPVALLLRNEVCWNALICIILTLQFCFWPKMQRKRLGLTYPHTVFGRFYFSALSNMNGEVLESQQKIWIILFSQKFVLT